MENRGGGNVMELGIGQQMYGNAHGDVLEMNRPSSSLSTGTPGGGGQVITPKHSQYSSLCFCVVFGFYFSFIFCGQLTIFY
jgi:hypothetical protein